MTIDAWIAQSEKRLRLAGIATPRLDTLVLLSDELSEDKSWILAHSDDILRGRSEKILNKKIIQRAHHTPLAYIRGHAEFYGRDFAVNRHVLVPRPESESIISLLKRYIAKPAHTTIVDVGTGSGCLAITAKLETRAHHVLACDISKRALRVAKKNAEQLCAEIEFVQGNLLKPIKHLLSNKEEYIVLANLPYVPTNYPINEAAKYEPPLALFSGDDGLEHYKQLFKQTDTLPLRPTIVITESLTFQHASLTKTAARHNYLLMSDEGLAQVFILSE